MLAVQIIGILLNIALFVSLDDNICNANDMLTCCFGYRWSATSSSCIECTQGFTGTNCTIQCPYPSYGRKCQKICTCEKSSCDNKDGCISSKEAFSASRLPDLGFSTIFSPADNQVTGEIRGGTGKQKIEKKSTALFFLVVGLVSLFVPLSLLYAIVKCPVVHKRCFQPGYPNRAQNEDNTYSMPIDMKL